MQSMLMYWISKSFECFGFIFDMQRYTFENYSYEYAVYEVQLTVHYTVSWSQQLLLIADRCLFKNADFKWPCLGIKLVPKWIQWSLQTPHPSFFLLLFIQSPVCWLQIYIKLFINKLINKLVFDLGYTPPVLVL